MSFPTLFASSYQLYKENTDRIAQWLLEAAQLCGYEHPSSCPSSSQDGAFTKRTPDTKNQQTDNHSPNPENKGAPVFRIGVADFTGLASIVANNANSTVPRKIFDIIQQTIDLRRAYARFYEKQIKEDIDITVANSRHMFFVNILEQVLLILQTIPTQGKLYRQNRQNSNGRKNATTLGNRFSTLEVDSGNFSEDETMLKNNQAIVRPVSTEPKWEVPQHILYEPDDLDLEFKLAVYCLFDDLHALHDYLLQVWKDYKSGDIDLCCASVVTNTAFDLAKRAENDFHQTFPKPSLSGTPSQPLCSFYFMLFAELGGIDAFDRQESHHLFNYEMMDVAQWLYLPTCLTLQDFCHSIEPGALPERMPTSVCDYIPKQKCKCCGGPSLPDILILDKIAIIQILTEIGPLLVSDNANFSQDALTAEIKLMYGTKQVSLFLAFATQVLLDVQCILGSQLAEPLHELQVTAHAIKSSIKTVFSTSSSSVDGCHLQRQALSQTLQTTEECVLRDLLGELRQSIFGIEHGAPDLGPYFLLSQQPVLCGLLKVAITLRMRLLGENLASSSGTLLSTAHLYNTLRKSSALDLPWPDMNLFICIHTPAKLFIGNVPKTAIECYRRYNLAIGMSAQVMSKERIILAKKRHVPCGGPIVKSEKGPRIWSYKSPLLEILEQRFLCEPRADKMIFRLEALFQANCRSKRKSDMKALTLFDGSTRTHNTQILRVLQDAMCQESHTREFDYFAMHYRCVKLLRRLKSWIADDIAVFDERDCKESGGRLPDIADFVMQQALMAEQEPRSCISGLGSCKRITVLNKVAKIMSQIIREEGSAEIEKLDVEIEFCCD